MLTTRFGFTAAMGAALLAVPIPAAPIPKDQAKDEALILGVWKIDKFEASEPNGAPPAELLDKIRFDFQKDGKLILTRIRDDKVEGTFKLDPEAKPKTIDMTAMENPVKGIYELTKDELRICMSEGKDNPRPTDFKAVGKRVALITLKRVEEGK